MLRPELLPSHPPVKKIIKQGRPDGTIKLRTVFVPADEDKNTHRQMLSHLQSLGWAFPNSVGTLPGNKLIENVMPHVRHSSERFLLCDLKDAFPSVDTDFALAAVYDGIKKHRGKDEASEVATFMNATSYMGYADKPDPEMRGLLQGLPCSPLFFDIISQSLDARLTRHLQQVFGDDVVYTRYLDDLTISSRDSVFTRKRRADIVAQIDALPGYWINRDKTKVQSLGRGALTITGLDVRRNRNWPTDPRVLVTPSGPNLARVEQAFDEMEKKLQEDAVITEEDRGRFFGMGSILHMAGEPTRSPMSSVRALERRFRAISERVKKLPSGRLF